MGYLYEHRKEISLQELKQFIKEHANDDEPLFIHRKVEKLEPTKEELFTPEKYWTSKKVKR